LGHVHHELLLPGVLWHERADAESGDGRSDVASGFCGSDDAYADDVAYVVESDESDSDDCGADTYADDDCADAYTDVVRSGVCVADGCSGDVRAYDDSGDAHSDASGQELGADRGAYGRSVCGAYVSGSGDAGAYVRSDDSGVARFGRAAGLGQGCLVGERSVDGGSG
jgi:hypothetical protein